MLQDGDGGDGGNLAAWGCGGRGEDVRGTLGVVFIGQGAGSNGLESDWAEDIQNNS